MILAVKHVKNNVSNRYLEYSYRVGRTPCRSGTANAIMKYRNDIYAFDIGPLVCGINILKEHVRCLQK